MAKHTHLYVTDSMPERVQLTQELEKLYEEQQAAERLATRQAKSNTSSSEQATKSHR